MDIRKIKKMIELLEKSGVAEIEIREGDRITKDVKIMTAESTGAKQ